MFKNIFIEKNSLTSEYSQNIIKNFPKANVQTISNIDKYFGTVKKPYLQKRQEVVRFSNFAEPKMDFADGDTSSSISSKNRLVRQDRMTFRKARSKKQDQQDGRNDQRRNKDRDDYSYCNICIDVDKKETQLTCYRLDCRVVRYVVPAIA